MDISVYTDASYCHKNKIAACGYFIICNAKPIKHDVILFENIENSTQAEQMAIKHGLIEAFLLEVAIRKIVVFSDCKTVIIPISNYIDGKPYRKRSILNGTLEIVNDIISTGIKLKLFYVKAHTKIKKQTLCEGLNKKVDYSVRAELRKYLKHSEQKL